MSWVFVVSVAVLLAAVVLIEVPDELIVDRITGRRMDPDTGDIYHMEFNPPTGAVAERHDGVILHVDCYTFRL